MLPAVKQYLREVESAHANGDATEHTYRPALKALVESYGKKLRATNEPKSGWMPDSSPIRARARAAGTAE